MDGFESYSEGLDLDGEGPNTTNLWAATDAVAQSAVTNTGSFAMSLTSTVASAVQTFNDGHTNVWTDLYVQPALGDNDSVTNPPTGSTFAFYVNTSSNIVVYDGTNISVVPPIGPEHFVFCSLDFVDGVGDLKIKPFCGLPQTLGMCATFENLAVVAALTLKNG